MNEIFLIILILILAAGGASVFLFLSRNTERRITDLMLGQSKTMNDQISSFTKEATQIKEDLKRVQESVKDVSTFQDIFKSPKLRGQWGEASLEHILSQHFPAELYKIQYLFPSGEQVDAVLFLPNGRVLPIDSKFPSENFDKMINSAGETEKNFFRKTFLEDVKNRINEIAVKYILPSEGTTDFALIYIPAEAVYYEIINNIGKDVDVAAFAWSKKIILTSPNTIYLTLRTIEHWFKDTQISKQTQEILRKLGKIHQDGEKLMDEFRKLGSHLRNASSAYDDSEKRLSLLDEKVEKLVELGDNKQLDKPAE